MSAFIQNVRYAFRLLAKNPGFTAPRSPAWPSESAPRPLFSAWSTRCCSAPCPTRNPAGWSASSPNSPIFPTAGCAISGSLLPNILDLKRDTKSFQAIDGWVNRGVNLAGAAEPVRATASYITGGMLSMLGVNPMLGRLFNADDDRPNVPLTAVISFGLWQRAFGGDRGVIGRDIRLNGNACHVIGVMPPGFAFPPGELDPPELWIPVQIDPAAPGGRGSHFLSVAGPLA